MDGGREGGREGPRVPVQSLSYLPRELSLDKCSRDWNSELYVGKNLCSNSDTHADVTY